MSSATKACPSCAHPLPPEAAFCMMCGAATPQAIDKHTGEIRQYTGDRIPSPDKSRLQHALGNNYELGKLIGRGGFAEVFLVHDRRLKRDLALKALRPDLVVSEALLTRFRREAETVAALRHPHIVPIYDIGEADGIAYILMPMIQGESLRALMAREGPRPVREAGRILLEASDALGAAHEAGVVHRDIKPENIMLEGKGRRVQLMDFGIAKVIDNSDTTPGLTSTGMLVGTPHYMSPEQASGESNLDHRSDQYSLAVVGFQMITGSLPFDGESTRAVLFQQMVGVPKSLRDLVPDVPASIAFAIDRALSKDPKDRFPSMEAFSEAISGADSWLGGSGSTSDSIVASRTTPVNPSITVSKSTGATPQPTELKPARRWVPIGIAAAAVLFGGAILTRLMTRTTGAPAANPAPVPGAPAPAPAPPSAATTPGPASVPSVQSSSKPGPPQPTQTAAASPDVPPTTGTCQIAVSAKKWAEAAKLCAAESDKGSAAASRMLAAMYEKGAGVAKSDTAAASLYKKAAGGGDAQASYRLGVMYATGTGLIQNDVEATAQLRKAADAGVPDAWPLLAERYEQGLGARRSDQEASFWYRRAAEAGNRAAQYNLGQMYLRGRGVEKSEGEASTWLSKAAEQGHPGAEYEIGMMYMRGKGGLTKDETVGLQWLEKAAAQGNEEAKKEVAKRSHP